MGEDKNQNWIGTLPHDFRINLHQNNPLSIVVLRPVKVLMANWLAGVYELWHHWRDGTNAGTDTRRLRRHYVKECQREDGTMRRMPWYIYLRRNRQCFKNKNTQPGLCANKTEIPKPAGQNMYPGTLHYCTHETSEVCCTSNSNIESLKFNQSFFCIIMYCSVL